MGQIVSFILQKGGCGKTTTTVNTGGYLAMQGFKVLCVDMDPQGNLTQHFGYDSESLPVTILELFRKTANFHQVVLKRDDALHILPNNLKTEAVQSELQKLTSSEYLLRDILFPFMNQYDFILIDCPPTLGFFSIIALVASTEFVLVVSPEFLPMKAIKPLYETFREVKLKLNHTLQFNGLVMTMCDFRTRHSQEILTILQQNFPQKLYKAYIRNNVSLKEASSFGQTIFEHKPQSTGAFDYQNFSEEFIRDHHKVIEKRRYYQNKYESLNQREKEQIMMYAKRKLSNFIIDSMEKFPDKIIVQEALLIERNKVIEELFPYRKAIVAEQNP